MYVILFLKSWKAGSVYNNTDLIQISFYSLVYGLHKSRDFALFIWFTAISTES